MYFENILRELKLPFVIERKIQSKIYEDEIHLIAETAYTGEDFDFALTKQTPEICLIVVVYLLQQKYDEYKDRGVPDNIIFDTFRDVTLRANLYYSKYGEVGITKDDVIWFRHIMNINIFKIGALQYQPFEMIYLDEATIGEPYMNFSESQKMLLPAKSPVINCHIQRGANLNNEAVGVSLKAAKEFFATLFPEIQYKAFLCYTWLLYPPMINCLSEKSNIRQFANRFTIIGTCDDLEQAMDNLQDNKETMLTKIAKENRSLFGFACGIIDL